MTTVIRPLDIDALHLADGGHDGPDNDEPGEMCLLEAAAWIAGEPWSDHPRCVCPVLAEFGRRLNDLLPDDRRQDLRHHLIPMLGTAGDGYAEVRRYMALDWAVRTATPMWLDAAGQPDHAAHLRDLAPITTPQTRAAMRPVLRQVADEMWALRRAKLSELRGAVADAVAAAAAVAVAAAAADAVAVAVAAAWQETYDRTFAAAKTRIEQQFAPTIAAVHDSAIDLFGRMIRPVSD